MTDVAHFAYLEQVAVSLREGKHIPLAPKFPAFYMQVEGFVEPKERARTSRLGHHYTPADTKRYEALVRETAGRKMAELGMHRIERPVLVHLTVKDQIHSATTEWQRKLMGIRMLFELTGGDLDNKVKAVLDGCNGIVYKDDRQIVQLFVTRVYADKASCEMHVTPVGFTKNDIEIIKKLVEHGNGQAKRSTKSR